MKPREILELGIHFVHKSVKHKHIKVISPSDGLNFHYRDLTDTKDGLQNSIKDTTARRFGPKLWKNIDKVCKEIFKNGLCPYTLNDEKTDDFLIKFATKDL